MKILIDAYLAENVGDDAFIHILCQRYPEVDFFAWTPYEFPYKNFHSKFNRIENRLLSRQRIYQMHFSKVDAVVVIGGSLFMEGISQNIDYSTLNVPWFLIGANFGPYHSESYLLEHQRQFETAFDLCFREQYSKELFSQQKARNAADLIFNLDFVPSDKRRQMFISVMDLEIPLYKELIRKLIELALAFDYPVVLAGFCKRQGDAGYANELKKMYPKVKVLNYSHENYLGFLEELMESQWVIGTRLHSILLGLLAGSKVVPLCYSHKTINLLKEMGFTDWIDLEDTAKLEDILRRLQISLSSAGFLESSHRSAIKADFQQDQVPVLSLDQKKLAELKASASQQFAGLDRWLSEQKRAAGTSFNND